jgi:hypothetical protein
VGKPFASGKKSIAVCDRCGFQFKLSELKSELVKQKRINNLVCRTCWTPDQPQLMLGAYPVDDPQAVRNPRPDMSYLQSGSFGEGSRQIQWGWAPVGGGNSVLNPMTPNALTAYGQVGTVTVSIS